MLPCLALGVGAADAVSAMGDAAVSRPWGAESWNTTTTTDSQPSNNLELRGHLKDTNSTKNSTSPSSNATLTHNSATKSSAPTKTNNNLVPHWSYEKNSIAAACTITAIAAIAVIVLTFLAVQKGRRSWARHNRQKWDYAATKYRMYMNEVNGDKDDMSDQEFNREKLMFGKSVSLSREYVVEQEGDKITRVYRAGRNDSDRTFDSVGTLPSKKEVLDSTVIKETLISDVDGSSLEHERSGAIPKPIIVVTPPLNHVRSMKATPIVPLPEIVSPVPVVPLPVPKESSSPPEGLSPIINSIPTPPEPARTTIVKVASDPNTLFQLPSLEKTTSPLLGSDLERRIQSHKY